MELNGREERLLLRNCVSSAIAGGRCNRSAGSQPLDRCISVELARNSRGFQITRIVRNEKCVWNLKEFSRDCTIVRAATKNEGKSARKNLLAAGS